MQRIFHFDPEKALQAVAFLLRRETGHRMNYMRLLKVLYIAERESLAESGKFITGSRVIAMERGPVLEDILSLIRGLHSSTPEWSRFIRRDRYHLEMTADPGVGRLSRFVREKLEEVADRHEEDDEWDMVAKTHELLEWQRNNPGTSSKEIPLVDILEAVGRRDDLQVILDGARRDARVSAFFDCPGEPGQSQSV
jgi:uncharacterized phage-associated protein